MECQRVLLLLPVVGLFASCSPRPSQSLPARVNSASTIQFIDATTEAKIHFVHNNGAFGLKWLPETMGSGVCWIDFDGDGYQDLFFVNGSDWPFPEAKRRVHPEKTQTFKLFRNRGDGTFEDVTEQSGLAIKAYGMGCCVGDYDNDGKPDLYVTALGRNYLFHNETSGFRVQGSGRPFFREVAKEADVIDAGWSTSCAWADYDRDGKLDLFVCHYVRWRSPKDHIDFSLTGDSKTAPSYNTPEAYTGEPCKLFHNEGGGKFRDVSAMAGITRDPSGKLLQGKSLGVTLCDYDGDGWPDLVVANDKEPNYVFHNRGSPTQRSRQAGFPDGPIGTGRVQGSGREKSKSGVRNPQFEEVGITCGVAVSSQGTARAAMGIHAADFGNSGREGFIIGNFTNEMLGLYENKGNGLFIDVAPRAGIGAPSRLFLSFGCFFADLDNDGWLDVFVANGHVLDDVAKVEKNITYAERPLLFRNKGSGFGVQGSVSENAKSVSFEEVGLKSGEALKRPIVARGAAAADYNLDGFVDVAVAQNNGPALLLKNATKGSNFLRVTLVGTKSNRSAIGAELQLKTGDPKDPTGLVQRRRVQSGGSYCSQSELPVTFGLGSAMEGELLVTWPIANTVKPTSYKVKANRWVTIEEGKGIVKDKAMPVANS